MLEYLLKFVVGGTIVVLVTYLAQHGRTSLSGIVAMAPAVTLVSYLLVAREQGNQALAETVRASLLSLPLAVLYLGTLLALLRMAHLRGILAILLSVGVWLVGAFVLYPHIRR